MIAAWLFFKERFKDVYFPDSEKWNSRITLSQFETGLDFDAVFSVRLLDGQLFFSLPANFEWGDNQPARERKVPVDSIFGVRSGEFTISIAIKTISREYLCFEKYRLPARSLTIGRSTQSDVCDPESMMSTTHGFLSFRGKDVVEYTDQSANGTYLNGQKILRTTARLQFGDLLTFPTGLKLVLLGNCIALNRGSCIQHVRLDRLPPRPEIAPSDEMRELPSVYVQYHRAPRMLKKTDTSVIEIEPPIAKQNVGLQPLWLQIGPSSTMVLPMLMGTMLAGNRTGGMLTSGIIMISTSSALAVMWGLINRRYRKKQGLLTERHRIALYQKYIQEMEDTLHGLNDREYQRLIDAYPNVGQCALIPGDPTRKLWDRMPTHGDFLRVRLGTGDVALPNEIQVQKQKLSIIDDPLRDEPDRLKRVYSTIADAPVTVDLRNETVVGVLGRAEAILFAQGLLMQIASLHSYHDVRIAVLTDEASASQWEWVRWLPHVFANEDREMRMVVSRPSAIHDVMNHLDEVLTMRKNTQEDDAAEKGEEQQEGALPLPHYIIFCTNSKLLEDEPILRRLLTNKLGMTLVMMAPSLEMLPKESHLIINLSSKPGFLHTSEGDTTQVDFEYANRNLLETFAQHLAPLRVRDAVENAAIPSLVSFLDIYGVRRTEDLDVWRLWTENHTYEGLRSVIGYSSGSRPFVLDISDKNHGPHGLIAGTTGSGKSVMLQTYILSLALNYSPNQVQFILIDYKGGGMADAFRTLPHVAGIIDNLQGERIIDRALASLNGEIHRRELLFKQLNVNNINDYTRYYENDPDEVKLPHLIIIVDEFAELKAEQPEFMRELVSASRVGRSLGVHLILATQKPSASVSDEIWANSRFHLCLRVQTRSDSMEMLKRPDAAYIKGMGRCFVQIGNDEIFEQVQTSYSGLPYNPNEPRAEEMPHLLGDTGQAVNVPRRRKSSQSGQKDYTQMDAVLDRITQVSGEHGMLHSKQLWLPEMRAHIYLSDMPLYRAACVRGGVYPNQPEGVGMILGMADDVARQRYIPYVINLSQMRNLMIVGLAGTGKTTAVQTMVHSLASLYDPEHLHMYILSLTSQTLGGLKAFPHVGDVAFENDEMEIKRFINMLFDEEARRSELFSQASTDSFIEFNRSQLRRGEKPVPAIVVFVDRFEQLKNMIGNDDFYFNRLQTLLREGSGRGIHFVVTAMGKNEIPSRLHPLFSGIALQLRERGDYGEVLGKRISSEMPTIANFPGRGIGMIGEEVFEIQLALGGQAQTNGKSGFASINDFMRYTASAALPQPNVVTDVERAAQISRFAAELDAAWTGSRPAGIPRIPEEPDFDRFTQESGYAEAQASPYTLPVGYDLVKGCLTSIDLEKAHSWLVLGPRKSGRTNMIKLLARLFSARGADVHIIGSNSHANIAKLPGVKLYTTPAEIIAFTDDFLKQYPGQRKPLRDAALAKGKSAARKQALEFKPCAVLIDDADIFNKDLAAAHYPKEAPKLQGVYSQMCSIATYYNIFLFMAVSTAERSAMLNEPLKTMLAQNRGIVLGGRLAEYDPLGVGMGLNTQQRNSPLPVGHGYIFNDGSRLRVITPLAEVEED